MMGMRMPKTCWAVCKWQTINLRDWYIWLVDLFEYMMMHELTNPKCTECKIEHYSWVVCIYCFVNGRSQVPIWGQRPVILSLWGFPWNFQANSTLLPQIKPWLLPFTCFLHHYAPIYHHSLLTAPFNMP
jgi:hypothetical protein